jgi:hypothetical protein
MYLVCLIMNLKVCYALFQTFVDLCLDMKTYRNALCDKNIILQFLRTKAIGTPHLESGTIFWA